MKYLSSNKYKRFVSASLLALFLLTLTSCSSGTEANTGKPMLLKPNTTDSGFKGNLVEVNYGTVSRVISGDAAVVYPISSTIVCNLNNARLVSVNIKRGDRVKEGDVIAEFVIEYDKTELDSMESELSIAEKQYEVMKSSYLSRVAAAEEKLASLRDQYKEYPTETIKTEISRAEINLKKEKSSYDFFVYEQERSLNSLRESILKFKKNLQNNKIFAPFDGVVSSAEYLEIGTVLLPGTKICTIYSDDVMWISTTSDVTNGMRYNSDAEIKVSNEEQVHKGRIITAPDLFGMPNGRVIIIPDEPIDYDNSNRFVRLSVTAQRYKLDNVLVLPQAAVEYEDSKAYVFLYEDGMLKKRYITVGLTSVDYVQILDGLEAGQIVVVD